MRDFLTGLAIILIIVLTTVLVAPFFVDWNGQRGFLEARLSKALGQKVTIGGNIDLRMLPTPYLTVDQVVVGGDEAALHVGVHRLDLELAVAPLLHGEFDIVEARLREPTIRLTLEHDRTLPALPAAPAFSAHVRFDRIVVSDGTFAIADPVSGRTFAFDHIDLSADAASFAGPFKISGTEGEAAHRSRFRLTTAATEKGHTRTKLVVEESKDHPAIDLDGTLDLQTVGDRVRQSFDGTLSLAGHAGRADGEPIGWKLTGPVKLDPKEVALEAGDLRLGNDEAGLTLQAEAKAELGEPPKLKIDLSAKQLDIDRLSGPPSDQPKPPPKLPDLATLRGMLTAALPPIETGIDLSVETATYGGETLSGIEVHLGLGDSTRQPLKLTIDGPGGAHVAADGTLETAHPAAFSGRLDIGADNLRRTIDWLARVAPDFTWSGGDLAFKTVRLAGRVDAGASRVDVADLSLDLDRSRLGGAAHFAAGDGSRAAKLTLDLSAKALDLDGLPSFTALRGGLRGLDLDARLDARAVKVSRVGEGTLDTGRIRLALTKTGQDLALETLRLDDLGGASVEGAGRLDPQGGHFAFTLDAGRLDAAAGLVRQLVPGAAADAFAARAPALTPAKIKLDLALAGDQPVPKTLSVTGTANKTKIDAQIRPEGDATSITASLQAPEGRILLRQLGLPTLSVETIGSSRVTLSARGRESEAFETVLSAAFGDTTADVTGKFKLTPSAIGGSGRLTMRSSDLSPLLQSLAVAFPDLTDRLPADMTSPIALDGGALDLRALNGRIGGVGVHGGLRWQRAAGEAPAITGNLDIDRLSLSSLFSLALGHEQPTDGAPWSTKPFAAGLIDPPRTTLTLATKSLAILPDLQGKAARMEIAVAPGSLSVSKFSTDVLDGTAEGGVLLRRDGRQATLEGRLTLNHVAVRVPGALDARMTTHLDLAGSGTSAASLVSSLAGSGDATTTDLTVPAADPGALAKVFADVEDDSLAADPDATARAYDEAAKGPLTTHSRHFAMTMAAGVARLVPATEQDAEVATKISAALDLGRLRIEEKVEETLTALPKNWSGSPPAMVMSFEGPINRPQRTIDMSGFSNALTARTVARESARIEAGALDLRERAMFSTRLKFEQRREDEKRKAEDDAREAEAERKRRLEALRQERQRREQAKKDKEKDKEVRDAAEKAARDHPNDTPNRDAPQAPAQDQGPPATGKDPSGR